MAGPVSVRIEGFDDLQKELKLLGPRGEKLMLGAMYKAGLDIAQQTRVELKKKKQKGGKAYEAWDSGMLGRSYTADIVGQSVEIGSPLIYAPAIETGRRPGRFPPPSELYQWVKRKLLGILRTWGATPSKRASNLNQVEGAAYTVARKIAEKGTEPHPHLGPAFDLKKNNVEKHAREAMEKL